MRQTQTRNQKPETRRRQGRAIARALLFSGFWFLVSGFLSGFTWRPIPARGVDLKLTQEHSALRLDFDFHGQGGYAIARREGAIELPENFELSFRMRADAPRNTLEVKFVQRASVTDGAENVWWNVRRELDFPREWRRFSVKKRNVEFAWGPGGPAPLPKRIDAIEIVITAGTGGKGTVWIEDVAITPIATAPEGVVPRVLGLPATFDHTYEIGGLVLDWGKESPSSYEIVTDHETRRIETNGGRDLVYLPDTETRTLDIRPGPRDVRVLPPMRSDNDFFAAAAKESKRGDYPRYLYGEQSYWTVIGGRNGEEAEALLSEDGVIEAGNARFSIEPLLRIDDQLVTWNDVEIEQNEGPYVSWKKHLKITPRVENNTLFVRYETAPNAKLFLAIRPFQVNPPWQFLKRTGGAVKVTRIEIATKEKQHGSLSPPQLHRGGERGRVRGAFALNHGPSPRPSPRDGEREKTTHDRIDTLITVDADERATIVATPTAFGVTSENVVEELRAGRFPSAQQAVGEFLSAALQFDERDVTIRIPLGPPGEQQPGTSNTAIDVPADPRIARTLAAQLKFILINRDGPSIQPGSRSYERSWIRDGSLTSAALLRLGRTAEAREFMEWYAKAIAADGYVPCCVSTSGAPDPVPEHDSHGQFLYLVAEVYRHTRDRAEAERMWPLVQRVVRFIDTLREADGIVPASISHEGYSAKPVHSYWDDFFILRGLKDAAFLARELSKPEAAPYEALRDEFRRDLLASIDGAMKKHGIDYIPGSVELGDFDATSTTVALSPLDEVDVLPQAALLRTFEKYWEHALEPRNYTPYELRVVGTFLRLGQPVRARALLDYFFDDQRPAAWHQWAEVVRRNPREPGFIGDMPHTWVGSDYIRSALDLFAYERGDSLIVGAGVAPEWLAAGVCVSEMSTHFGMLSYSMNASGMHIEAGLRVPPGGILVISPIDGSRTVIHELPAEVNFRLPLSAAASSRWGEARGEGHFSRKARPLTLALSPLAAGRGNSAPQSARPVSCDAKGTSNVE